jgi:hypothetical protein
MRLVGIYIDLGEMEKSGMEGNERRIKMAAASKIRRMVQHAMLLHNNGSNTNLRQSTVSPAVVASAASLFPRGSSTAELEKKRGETVSKALIAYQKMQETKETTGGIFWTYRGLWDRSLWYQEGIYFHGRLIAMNFIQFFIAAIMVAIAVTYLKRIEKILKGVDDHCTVRVEDLNTIPIVDPDFNETVNGFVNIFNVNSTHFSPDGGYTYVEGQFPKYNGTHFDTGDKTVCYLDQIAGVEKPKGPPPPPPRPQNNTNTTHLFGNFTGNFTGISSFGPGLFGPGNATGMFNVSAFGPGMGGIEGPPEGGGPPDGAGPPEEGGGGSGGNGQEGGVDGAVEDALGALGDLFSGEIEEGEDQSGPEGDGTGKPPGQSASGEKTPPVGFSPLGMLNETAMDATESISTRLVMNPGARANDFLELADIQEWE